MAGKTPKDALANFVGPLQVAVSCISKARLNYVQPTNSYDIYSLLLSEGRYVALKNDERLCFYMGMKYRYEMAEGERGKWKVKTAAYAYEIKTEEEKDLIAFHWHPDRGHDILYPHIHICHATGITHRGIRDGHIPSGRVAAEEVIRFAIEAMGVKPLRQDWKTILKRTQDAFEKWKTW